MPFLSTALSMSAGFHGCTAEAGDASNISTNAIITTCCERVGSTAVTANGTFGCPYNAVWNATLRSAQEFMACGTAFNAGSLCIHFQLPGAPNSESASRSMFSLRRHGFVVGLLVGVAVLSLVLNVLRRRCNVPLLARDRINRRDYLSF
ncbi:hypothetical protein B0H10DRAFT_1961055 [Mycena sp. CBHHK59/15]|nr:hypothetical protein B0H10DRAFT_1961055 [Mycena sp. CBHHK59/15]